MTGDTSESRTSGNEVGQDPCRDEVVESTSAPNGTRVDLVRRNGHREDRTVLKVYGTREDTHRSLDSGEVRTTERQVTLNEMPEDVGYEVLVALAEHYGYRLEGK